MGILLTETSMVRAVCVVKLKDRITNEDLMLRFCLTESIEQLAMTKIGCWYRHVLQKQNCHFVRRAL